MLITILLLVNMSIEDLIHKGESPWKILLIGLSQMKYFICKLEDLSLSFLNVATWSERT